MAICYIYYTNNTKNVTAYLWEPNQKTIKYNLRPYNGSEDVFACKELLINFPKKVVVLKREDKIFESLLRDPTKDYKNLKHQAHFDFDQGNWGNYVEIY